MSKRVTSSRIKRWGIGIGATGIPLAILLIWLLVSMGSIEITGYSKDSVCDGTESNPCYAYINFTAKEDIFIYPGNWSNTAFYTDPQPKSVKMYRSWGKGWREIKLNQSCKGTWCGLSNSKDKRKFAYAFREGRNYQIRYKVLKNSPKDSVKWGYENIDPIFYGWGDNKLSYSNNDLDVLIKDALGKNIGKAKLTSHKSTKEVLNVIRGENRKVMIYNLDFDEIIENGLGEVIFTNMNTNQTEKKEYHFEKAVYYNVTKDILITVCEVKESDNGTEYSNCVKFKTGEYQGQRKRWELYNSTNIPNYPIEIALVTDVNANDYFDAKWEIVGKYISLHAEWIESLNIGLAQYYNFEEGSGSVIEDVRGGFNGTAFAGTNWEASCHIGACLNSSATGIMHINNNLTTWLKDQLTINFWVYEYDEGVDRWLVGEDEASNLEFKMVQQTTTRYGWITEGADNFWTPVGSHIKDEWAMITLMVNATGKYMYLNGSRLENNTAYYDFGFNNLTFGYDTSTNVDHIRGMMDEIGIWNRSLNESEIVQLWNGGIGITYSIGGGDEFPQFSSYVSSPANNTIYSSGTVYEFNATITSTNGTSGLEFDGINYTVSNLTSSLFNSTINDLGGGDYTYYWWSYGNGSNNNYNISGTQYYTIAKDNSISNLTFNYTEGNITWERGDSILINGSVVLGENGIFLELYNNETLINNKTVEVSNTTSFDIPAEYNITLIYPESQNFTQNSKTYFINITETTNPLLTIISPTNQTYQQLSLDFNVSSNEELDTCFFSLDNFLTNTTMTKYNNTYFNYTDSSVSDGSFNAKFWCNNTYNLINNTEEVFYTINNTQIFLLSPEDDFISNNISNLLSCFAESINSISNLSLYTNESGTWEVNQTFNYDSNYYVWIVADSVVESPFNINNVSITKINDSTWKVSSNESDYEVQRAQIMKTLFYGTNGNDPTILNVINISELITSDSDDVGLRGYFANVKDPGGTASGKVLGNFSDTSTNNVSSWSNIYGSPSDKFWKVPDGTTLNIGGDEMGTDTSGDEVSNPTNFSLSVNYNGAGSTVGTVEVIILSKGAISFAFSGSGSHTEVDYFTDNSIPEFTIKKYYEIFNISLVDPIKWSCYICTVSNTCEFSTENRTIDYDNYNPTINIVYPANDSYFINVSELNYTSSDDYPDSCWYSKDGGVTNSTPVSFGNNFTNVVSNVSSNTWDLYCNDSNNLLGNDSVTFIVKYIDYTADSDVSNITANFSIKDNIWVNVSVADFINESNITFNLWTSTNSSFNITVFNDSTRNINYTSLSEGVYFWNVSVCDVDNVCYTTEERYYGVENLSLLLEGVFDNLNIELGSNITINATSNYQNISVDINHPSYGVNYSVSKWIVGFNVLIDYFQKVFFSDNSISKLFSGFYLNGSSYENVSSMNFSVHQYDEIINLSVNMSGSNNPRDIVFYKVNSTNTDRSYFGILDGDKIHIDQLWDTSNGTTLRLNLTNISYNNYGEKLIYIYVDDNAVLENFTLNVSGFKNGFNFTDNFSNFDYIDTVLTNADLDPSGVIMPPNSSYKEFVYDDFEDNVIDVNSMWDKTSDFSYSATCTYSGAISEQDGYIKMLNTYSDINDECTGEIKLQLGPNITNFNLYTSDEIKFDILDVYSSSAGSTGCDGKGKVYVGTNVIWTSYYISDDGDGDDAQEDSTANLSFYLQKVNSTSWFANISGYETSERYETAGCGQIDVVYNWTTGIWNATKENCVNTNGTLNKSFYFDVTYEGSGVFPDNYVLFENYVDDAGFCQSGSEDMRIYYVNNSKWSRTNGTVKSTSVFDSSVNINSVTLEAYGGGTATFFISGDDGEHWQNINTSVSTPLTYPGKHIKWMADFNLTEEGYVNSTSYLDSVNVYTSGDYPSNLTFDFGNDGINEDSIAGYINETNGTINVNLSGANLTTAFTSEYPSVGDHTYLVPLEIHSDTAGIVEVSAINLTYNPNPVILNSSLIQTFIQAFTNFLNFSIEFGAENTTSSSGINISNIKLNYAGGNKTYEVLAHNDDYSVNLSKNITYYYSRWDYSWMPVGVSWLYFTPTSPNEKNVTPYGQTLNTPIFNITNYGYGGKNVNLSVYVNDTLSCINTTISLTQNKSDGVIVNSSWIELDTNISYLNATNISMWSDYNCSYSNWQLFDPAFYFRACCDGCICAEEVL